MDTHGKKFPPKNGGNTVILLPQAADHYQQELTILLENERFGEAISMLEFLLQCKHDDNALKQEWQMLLAWLRKQFPAEGEKEACPEDGPDGESAGEEELLKQKLASKLAEDPDYVDKMLSYLDDSHGLDKQMLALEQLMYLQHPEIAPSIKDWLEGQWRAGGRRIHPLVEFRAWQVLKAKQAEGITVQTFRRGLKLQIDVATVPLKPEQFPPVVLEVLRQVRQLCENHNPGLRFFAETVWMDWLAATFGTPEYEALIRRGKAHVWAAALYETAMRMMSGTEPEPEVPELSGLTVEERREKAAISAGMLDLFAELSGLEQ